MVLFLGVAGLNLQLFDGKWLHESRIQMFIGHGHFVLCSLLSSFCNGTAEGLLIWVCRLWRRTSGVHGSKCSCAAR
jgi:hypothetical protein